MKKTFKTIFIQLFFLVNISAQAPAVNIPLFKFFKVDKTAFTNTDLAAGKPLLFVFFDVTCDHCQRAVSYINMHYTDFKKAGLYFITLDEQSKLAAFMNQYGPNLQGKKNIFVVQDLNNEFIKKFGPRKYPSIFLYSSKRILIKYDDNELSLPAFSKAIQSLIR